MLIAGLQLPLDAEVNAETMTQFMIRITKLTYEPLYETHLVHTLNCIVDAFFSMSLYVSQHTTNFKAVSWHVPTSHIIRNQIWWQQLCSHTIFATSVDHRFLATAYPSGRYRKVSFFFIHWFTTHWYLKINKNCMFSIFLTHFQHLQWYQRPNRVSPRRFEQSNFHRNTNRHVPSPHKQPIPVDIIN